MNASGEYIHGSFSRRVTEGYEQVTSQATCLTAGMFFLRFSPAHSTIVQTFLRFPSIWQAAGAAVTSDQTHEAHLSDFCYLLVSFPVCIDVQRSGAASEALASLRSSAFGR